MERMNRQTGYPWEEKKECRLMEYRLKHRIRPMEMRKEKTIMRFLMFNDFREKKRKGKQKLSTKDKEYGRKTCEVKVDRSNWKFKK